MAWDSTRFYLVGRTKVALDDYGAPFAIPLERAAQFFGYIREKIGSLAFTGEALTTCHMWVPGTLSYASPNRRQYLTQLIPLVYGEWLASFCVMVYYPKISKISHHPSITQASSHLLHIRISHRAL